MVKNLPPNAGDVKQRLGFDPRASKIPWSKKRQPTPVFLPRKFHGQRSLGGYSPWGLKELDMTEHAHTRSETEAKCGKEDVFLRRKTFSKLREKSVA